MKKLILKTTVALVLLSLIVVSCKKKSSNPCSGITVVVSGTVTSSNGNDGSITATASGGTTFTYSINGGTYQASGNFTSLSPGNYNIIAKNQNGCTGSKAFIVAGTNTYFLTKSTWKFSSATVNGADASSYLQACQKDNVYTFAAAGTGNIDEGPSKCNSGDPQTITFTWNFASNETILHASTTFFSGGTNDFNIVTLSNTQLVVSFPYSPPVGPSLQMVVTFIH